MTLVICPNLAVDRLLAGDRPRPGRITRYRALRTQAGGKGSNVLRATLALGGAGTLIGFAAGRGGRLIADLAGDEGLRLVTVTTGGEARVSTVVLGDDGSVTRLYEFGPAVSAGDEELLVALAGRRAAAPGEWAVVTGAAPPGVTPDFYAALVHAARDTGHHVLVDATGEHLVHALAARPDLVKINLGEGRAALGEPGARNADEEERPPQDVAAEGLKLCRRLVEAGAAGAVLTLGAAGAVAKLDGAEWRVASPTVRAVNPVGSGDCFAAALVLAMQRDESPPAALGLAAAAGAANAATLFSGHLDAVVVARLTGSACVIPAPAAPGS